MEGCLVLFSVNRPMGEDISRLGIYGEQVYWVLIYSMTTYMELLVSPLKFVKHLAAVQKSAYWPLQICS